MSRVKSVILSAAEKKNAVGQLKLAIKSAKESVTGIAANRKNIEKVFAAASKQHVADLKSNDKYALEATKKLGALNAQMIALAAPVLAIA